MTLADKFFGGFMALNYEPGQEIELAGNFGSRRFFAKAVSWREQQHLDKKTEEIAKLQTINEQSNAVVSELVLHITRTDPPMEITCDSISEVIDRKQIFDLWVAHTNNLTVEEKKSSE